MKKQIFKPAAVLVLMAAMVISVQAQHPQYGKDGQGRNATGSHQQARGEWMANLDLSDEQKEHMKELRVSHYKTMEPLRNKMAELRAKQRTLMSEENVDMKAVHQCIDDQTALQNKIKKRWVEHRLSVKDILTDEQEMMIKGHRERHRQHRHRQSRQ